MDGSGVPVAAVLYNKTTDSKQLPERETSLTGVGNRQAVELDKRRVN